MNQEMSYRSLALLLYWLAVEEEQDFGDDGDHFFDGASSHKIPSIIFVRKTTTMAPNANGRKSGASNYCKLETKHLFDIMENLLPIGPDEWQQVADMHAIEYSGRDVDSIRRKYSSLYRKPIPTGDPLMPDDVRQAKPIKWKIGKKASVGDGKDDFTLGGGFAKPSPPPPAIAPSQTETAPTATDSTETPPEPTVTTASRSTTSVAASSHSVTPSKKRAYNSKSAVATEFLEAFQLSIKADREARERDREERRQDRKDMLDAITAFASGVVGAFAANKKRKHNEQEEE